MDMDRNEHASNDIVLYTCGVAPGAKLKVSVNATDNHNCNLAINFINMHVGSIYKLHATFSSVQNRLHLTNLLY